MKLTPSQEQNLIDAALKARAHAHAPYSNFLVGAALLTASGRIISGCNVENASYGLTICAERVAVGTAIAAGENKFLAVAIASTGGVTPCGACRQVLSEFSPDLPILLVNSDSPRSAQHTDLAQLLPGQFHLKGIE
jgi:cytidine deaminase